MTITMTRHDFVVLVNLLEERRRTLNINAEYFQKNNFADAPEKFVEELEDITSLIEAVMADED